MKLDKAIEILTILENRSINNSTMFKKDALKLGIEALQRVKWHKEQHRAGCYELLPGETKE